MSNRNKKQIFTNIEVLDAGAKGKTIAKAPDGKVIFLLNAVPGDVVDVQTFKKRKAYYEGKAIMFHKLSDKRTQPACEHFGVCGGCKWQHLLYSTQLSEKETIVRDAFQRIAKVEPKEFLPIVGGKFTKYYRNKLEFSFSNKRWLSDDEVRSDEDFGERIETE